MQHQGTSVTDSLLTLQARFISHPFVSLTQDARIAERSRNMAIKGINILLLKQRHFTAEGAEIAEEDKNRVTKATYRQKQRHLTAEDAEKGIFFVNR